MSEYLLARYRPVVDELLRTHGLAVPPATRDNLAKSVKQSRELPRAATAPKHTPRPALLVAAGHARALLRYAENPPTRPGSIPLRCAKLAMALNTHALVGLALILGSPTFDTSKLLAKLEINLIDTKELSSLLSAIDALKVSGWKIGRPWAISTPIVRGGCIAWKKSGRRESFTWNEITGSLNGPLPDFLRDLISCCNGTHRLVQRLCPRGSQRSAERPMRRRGDGLRLSDQALHVLIDRCKKADLL